VVENANRHEPGDDEQSPHQRFVQFSRRGTTMPLEIKREARKQRDRRQKREQRR
jgi:hypothetical protein